MIIICYLRNDHVSKYVANPLERADHQEERSLKIKFIEIRKKYVKSFISSLN